jgi:antitoxin component of RelBE/YafQ-DinJ toxin-antitoxin module
MKTQVTITLDVDVKRDLQSFAKEVGMTMSSLLNLSAKKLTHTRHLDFDFSRIMMPEDMKIEKSALADLKKGKFIYRIDN